MNMYINHQMHRTVNESMKHSVCAQITNKEFINRLNFHISSLFEIQLSLYTIHPGYTGQTGVSLMFP